MFVYGPELLLIGKWPDIVLAATASVVGIFLLSASIQGYLLTGVGWVQRIILFVSALLLIKPGLLTDLLGLAGGLLVIGSQIFGEQKRKQKP
jgi:TRAP-type uncharacterized transport system fused permease subunit